MSAKQPPTRRGFGAIAEAYDQHAVIQREVAARLLDRLEGLKFQPKSILDLGCATGHQALDLRKRYPQARIVAMDAAPAMLQQARRQRGRWRRRFELVAGDAEALPLAAASIDLVYSSMTLEWCRHLPDVLSALRRVIRPGGMLLLATTGPDTLRELHQALQQQNQLAYTGGTIDAMRLGDALVRAGFQEPVIDTDWLTTTHADPAGLIDDLEYTGSNLGSDLDRSGLRHAYECHRNAEGLYPATWEIVYASAWAPEEGQPIRTDSGEEASFTVENLKVRSRR